MNIYRSQKRRLWSSRKSKNKMSGRGGFNNRGRGSFNNRGGGGANRGRQGGGGRRFEDDSNVQTVECGTFDSRCGESAIFKLSTSDGVVPLTQTFLYDDKKNKIGKIKDVFGPMDKVYFEMGPLDDKSSIPQNLKEGSKVYAPENRLHPPSFYTDDQPKRGGGGRGGRGGGGRGGRGGGGRGGRGGGGRGGRGGGGGRGGFGNRGRGR